MDSTHPNGARRVVITLEQRDALHLEIREYWLGEGPLRDLPRCLQRFGGGEPARELWVPMSLAARILDDIGWDRSSGSRDSYALTLDAELVRWFKDQLEQSDAFLADESKALAEIRTGKDPWLHPAYGRGGGTLEEDTATLRDRVDRELEFNGACRAILEQVGES